MNPDISAPATSTPPRSRLESVAFYILLASVFLAPLAFWSSAYVALDLIKTVVIILGTLSAAILILVTLIQKRRLVLPPKHIFYSGLLLAFSMLVSAALSIHFMKSLIGQGFEVGTAGFLLALFVAGLVSFWLVQRKAERSLVIYAAMASAYVILAIFQALRFAFGASFASLGILNTVASSVVGNWSSFGYYSGFMLVLTLSALFFLKLSRRMQIVYGAIGLIAAAGIFAVNLHVIWLLVALVLLGMCAVMTSRRPRAGAGIASWLKRLAWTPLVLAAISLALFSRQAAWSAPILNAHNAANAEVALPWQMTLDVVAGAIKNYPLFGIGPNHFTQAYLVYKPAGVNETNAWGIEFGTGFGLLPTLVAAQGLVGSVLWILFLVFIGMAIVRTMRRLPDDPGARFTAVSAAAGTSFLWLASIFFVPAHAVLFLTALSTGIFMAIAVSSGAEKAFEVAPAMGSRCYKFMPSIVAFFIVIAAVWGLMYVKRTAALAYFSAGVSQLTSGANVDAADADFSRALSIDTSDVYWQAKAEAALSKAAHLSQSGSNATTTAAVQALVTTALSDAQHAIAYDPTNYYNYVSLARASESASSLGMSGAYDRAISAYNSAISENPSNPSLYLALSRFQANNNKLDDALRSVGAALRVKTNYLDAVFLLSQIDAAKGNLPEAITAAQYAVTIDPTNPLLYFQLGLLDYNAKDYAGAAAALGQAVKIQPDYANAQYFLGLADARLGNIADAISQFAAISQTNPDNREVSLILANLKAGKPIFADAVPPVTPSPETRQSLPINEKQK
ncbi:MAG: tetratricopeptide repeat protein [Patescibacteria group bacterium]|nr:tetratricopeptide repeat protein [Patescibacteria group bacterium]MDE2172352.1 tetratricopeptide repeat protein [Patescibacteria group bacterium]